MNEGRPPTWIFFSELPLKIEVKLTRLQISGYNFVPDFESLV